MLGPAKTLAVSRVTNPRWSAPEVIRESSVSTSSDVFSFAIVMWELLTWQQPYEEMMSVQVRGTGCAQLVAGWRHSTAEASSRCAGPAADPCWRLA